MQLDGARILLIDPDDLGREVLARRLRAQGCAVETHAQPEHGAAVALSAPPDAVIADLWMPMVSGVQLCRLLRAEPATADVPVILRATSDGQRDRFWARKAGAAGYVAKGRMGELLRALERTLRPRTDFFFQLGQDVDIRARIASHLDRALFQSVVANELRSLGGVGSFDRLVDQLSQLLAQVMPYHWVAISTSAGQLGLHCRPGDAPACLAAARAAIGATVPETEVVVVEDEDAGLGGGTAPIVATAAFGAVIHGTIALVPSPGADVDQDFVDFLGRELGAALRMLALVEETRRLAETDPLTGLLRRTAFVERVGAAAPAGADTKRYVVLVDVDHFKAINDGHGHATGDRVLAAIGSVFGASVHARGGFAARWGGEELVAVIPGLGDDDGLAFAEELRARVSGVDVASPDGVRVRVTASFGVAQLSARTSLELAIDRADHAMYASKAAGRDRVTLAA